MRNFTFKGLFLAVVFMVLGSLSIQAADDGLITKQITVKLEKAGTLRDKIGSTKRDKITNLKIIGEINGSDWSVIRYMAGRDYYDSESDGKLAILDLSETKIVSGGGRYLYDDYNRDYYTHDNELGSRAFYNCTGLTSLSLPSGITFIGSEAFSGCSGLTSLSLPSGLTSIGSEAFSGCSGLTSLSLPSGLTSIGSEAFSGCSGLTSLSLPSGLTSIGSEAFSGCSGLTSLSLPSGLTSIDFNAFSGCSGLTSLSLPSGLTSIDFNAFSGCSGLTSLSLPSGLTSIGVGAFSGCSGLTSLSLPSGLTSIGNVAFSGCSGLTSIYVYTEKLPNMGSDVFDGCDAKKCTVYVPKGTYDDYWLSEFGYFENIVEFEATGINNVITSNDAKELSRYSVNGQRLSAPTKGLNIVKYSNGSVKKVAVQ